MINLSIIHCFGHYTPYDSEPFYAAMFSIALLILLVGYIRRRRFSSGNTPILNSDFEIQQFDVLGQPQIHRRPLNEEHSQ